MITLNQKNNKKGFTLIELLVVVSIIGMLSSVVMAGLVSARQKAKATKVVAEMNQLKIAFDMYRNDKGKYPGEGDDGIAKCSSLSPDICKGDNDFVNYLNEKLVPKYISSISNTDLRNNDEERYIYYLAGTTMSSGINDCGDGNLCAYGAICGNKILKSYILVFYSKEKLNFSKADYYEFYGNPDYSAWGVEPWDWADNTNHYCIGE